MKRNESLIYIYFFRVLIIFASSELALIWIQKVLCLREAAQMQRYRVLTTDTEYRLHRS